MNRLLFLVFCLAPTLAAAQIERDARPARALEASVSEPCDGPACGEPIGGINVSLEQIPGGTLTTPTIYQLQAGPIYVLSPSGFTREDHGSLSYVGPCDASAAPSRAGLTTPMCLNPEPREGRPVAYLKYKLSRAMVSSIVEVRDVTGLDQCSEGAVCGRLVSLSTVAVDGSLALVLPGVGDAEYEIHLTPDDAATPTHRGRLLLQHGSSEVPNEDFSLSFSKVE